MRTFSQRQQPAEAQEVSVPREAIANGHVLMPALLTHLGLTPSNSEARRLMQAGAVTVDGEKLTDPTHKVPIDELSNKVLKVGKHQFRKLLT